MSEPIPISLGQSSAPTRHGYEGASRHINCYSEEAGKEAEVPVIAYARNGLDTFSSSEVSGGVRAMMPIGNRLLAVKGRTICSIDSSGASSIIGGLASDGLVTMAANKRSPSQQVAICCDGVVMMYQAGAVTQITDEDLNAATSVIELDGYMLYGSRNGKLVASDLNSADVIDGLSYATAEASSDELIRVGRRGQEAVVFGAKTTEFWTNVAGDPFPFGRSTVRHYGCAAAGSVADLSETLVFVDHRRHVRLLNGYDAQRISTPPVERALEDETDLSSVRGFAFVERGHEMYALTGTAFTWVYDVNTGLWHERKSYGLSRWRVDCSCEFNGETLFGAYNLPIIYRSDPDLMDDDGDPIEVIVQPPPITAFPKQLSWDRLDIRMTPGVGLNTTAPAELSPEVMVDFSEDGGRTFGAQEHLALGEEAQGLTTLFTTNLGLAPRGGRTLRLSTSASVVRSYVSAHLTATRTR